MPATSPAPKAENRPDGVVLQTRAEREAGDSAVPRFALIEMRGPDPRAVVLSPLILTTLLFTFVMLGRVPHSARVPLAENVTWLEPPPEPLTVPDVSTLENHSEISSLALPTAEPVKVDQPAPGVPQPQPGLSKDDPAAPDRATAEPVPPEMGEKPAQITTPAEHSASATSTAPSVVKRSDPAPVVARSVNDASAHSLRPELDTPESARDTVVRKVPESLGGVPLSQLIADQDGLAAGLAALPSNERLGLPRVSIRVNAEWLQALPKTQERLYFSITTPQPDREVLAYLPDTHSFDLERPEHPLWKIHDGERVPALADLREEAARWLGVSPELVGLYTWHPPVFEDALRMFVLERLQELRVHLGPRDIVTVRLAPGPEGTVMNLEPIREGVATN